jgi:hypothetical protein
MSTKHEQEHEHKGGAGLSPNHGDDLSRAQWRKSTRSNGGEGACVEVAQLAHGIAVRDSKDPEGPTLVFSRSVWRGFARGLTAEE